MTRPEWFPDWRGETCALIGAGSSATKEAVDRLRGRCRVLVVNTSYKLVPWADALYAADARWWDWHGGAKEFRGLKITQDKGAAEKYRLRCVSLVQSGRDLDAIIIDRPGLLGHGRDGGFQALNLIVQFGARRIPMLGIDCCGDRWHGDHPEGRKVPLPKEFELRRAIYDAQASRLTSLGVEVVNCSAISALTGYPRLSVEEALARWQKIAA